MAPVLEDSTAVRIDLVTLAALEDTGWYAVNLSWAQGLLWGDGKGRIKCVKCVDVDIWKICMIIVIMLY